MGHAAEFATCPRRGYGEALADGDGVAVAEDGGDGVAERDPVGSGVPVGCALMVAEAGCFGELGAVGRGVLVGLDLLAAGRGETDDREVAGAAVPPGDGGPT